MTLSTSAFHQVIDKIPFIDTAQPPEAPRVEQPIQGAEIAYTDVDKDGRPVPPVLEFYSHEAFKDAKDAARAFGYLALVYNMQERQNQGFEPVPSDEIRVDESTLEEWKQGKYNPNVFRGQTALALRWLLEEAATNPTSRESANGGHVLPKKLWSRMVTLNEKTTPINDVKAQVHPRVVQIAEEVKAQEKDPNALFTDEGGVSSKVTVGIDYDVIRDTDPGIPKYPHDTAA